MTNENSKAIAVNTQRYARQSGAVSRNQAIVIIMVLSTVVAFLSTAGSAYGIYFDLLLDYGHMFALFIAILGGVFIEAVKYTMIKVYFAWEDNKILQLVAFVILAVFTGLAIALHYLGADNMHRTKTVQIVDKVQERNALLQAQEQDRKDKIVEIASGVVKNGTIHDDKIAMKTLSNINNYQNSLLSRGEISKLDNMQINEVKRAAAQRADSLKIILPIFEILSIFGFLGAYLTKLSTPSASKEILKEQEEYDVVDALSPTPNTHEHVTKSIIDDMRQKRIVDKKLVPSGSNPTHLLNDPKSTNFSHTVDPKGDPKIHENLKNKTNFEECKEEVKEEGVKSFKEQAKAKEEELFTIDLMKYPVGYNEVIKAMFDNGTLKKHDYLVPKEQVIKKLGITKAYYETVAYDLKKNKHIVGITGKGYMALSDLKNEVKTA